VNATTTPPTAATVLGEATLALSRAGVATPQADAEWLLAGALGIGRAALRARLAEPLAAGVARAFQAAVRRRTGREPLQHVLGWEAFRGVRLRVTPQALVPRPETEVLTGWALEVLAGRPRPVIVDVGTGSGCIACAIATERPDARVIAVDRSPEAVALARANVMELGLGERVDVILSDLFAGLGATRADLIVSNPPYLPTALIPTLAPEVSRHDPREALDGGVDGLDVVRALVAQAPARLASDGALLLETGGGAQLDRTASLMRTHGLSEIQTRPDLAGVVRFIMGRRQACQRDS
jgi:release factor glutamine methyltransferase